jgi:hypothetical protein
MGKKRKNSKVHRAVDSVVVSAVEIQSSESIKSSYTDQVGAVKISESVEIGDKKDSKSSDKVGKMSIFGLIPKG